MDKVLISIIIFFFILTSQESMCQVDSSQVDSSVKKTTFRPKPKKALILSLVLPGSGQIYNRHYWKAPIVYGGFVGIGYWIYSNNKTYRLLKDEYIYRVAPEQLSPDFVTQINSNVADNSIRSLRDSYRKSLEKSYFALIGYYGLVAIEAFIDANLQQFDISEDLSLGIKPKGIKNPFSREITPGIGISLNFK